VPKLGCVNLSLIKRLIFLEPRSWRILFNEQVSHMPAYDSVQGQLVHLQAELLNILEHMVVAQRRTDFWAPWCIYFHDCLALRTLSGCVVEFILFYDEVEGCIGVYTD
jgi:hypothetical protein